MLCTSLLQPQVLIKPGGDLTPEQEAQLQLQAAQMAAKNAQNAKSELEPPVTPDNVKQWIDIGTYVGQGFNATAKELGKTADELLTTNVGMIAMALLVWNYVGNQLVGIVVGMMWYIVLLPAWWILYRRLGLQYTVNYYENGKKKDVSYTSTRNGNIHGTFIMALIVIMGVGLIILFA